MNASGNEQDRRIHRNGSGWNPMNAREAASSFDLTEQKPRVPKADGEKVSRPKKRKQSPILRFLIKCVLLTAIFMAVFRFVLGAHIQHGYGMNPHIKDGDLLITYKLEAYRVGDAVEYRDPITGKTAVSRIVAIGKAEIQITEMGELLINGYISEDGVFYPTRIVEDSEVTFPYHMSEDGYFLLDDFRIQGSDSRVFGEVTKDDLLGKVVYVFRRRGI